MFVGPNKSAYTSSSETLVLFDVFEMVAYIVFHTHILYKAYRKKKEIIFLEKSKKREILSQVVNTI